MCTTYSYFAYTSTTSKSFLDCIFQTNFCQQKLSCTKNIVKKLNYLKYIRHTTTYPSTFTCRRYPEKAQHSFLFFDYVISRDWETLTAGGCSMLWSALEMYGWSAETARALGQTYAHKWKNEYEIGKNGNHTTHSGGSWPKFI